jgi:hypothetical protein
VRVIAAALTEDGFHFTELQISGWLASSRHRRWVISDFGRVPVNPVRSQMGERSSALAHLHRCHQCEGNVAMKC